MVINPKPGAVKSESEECVEKVVASFQLEVDGIDDELETRRPDGTGGGAIF